MMEGGQDGHARAGSEGGRVNLAAEGGKDNLAYAHTEGATHQTEESILKQYAIKGKITSDIKYSVFTNFCLEIIERYLFFGLLPRENSGDASEVRRREHGSNIARLEAASELKQKDC